MGSLEKMKKEATQFKARTKDQVNRLKICLSRFSLFTWLDQDRCIIECSEPLINYFFPCVFLIKQEQKDNNCISNLRFPERLPAAVDGFNIHTPSNIQSTPLSDGVMKVGTLLQ